MEYFNDAIKHFISDLENAGETVNISDIEFSFSVEQIPWGSKDDTYISWDIYWVRPHTDDEAKQFLKDNGK